MSSASIFRPAATPAHDGLMMPAEWHPHKRCWILWPHREDNWRNGAEPARVAFAAVIAAISEFEHVSVGVPAAHMASAVSKLQHLAPKVDLIEIESDDSWMRDTGPTFVIGDKGVLKGVHWHFNAWGQLGLVDGVNYVTWEKDKHIAAQALQIAGADRYRADFVLEGGSIHVDGEGTCLTTEECLLNKNRNPDLSREEIEARLRLYLGQLSLLQQTIIVLYLYSAVSSSDLINFC
jgi:agmatine deiminase